MTNSLNTQSASKADRNGLWLAVGRAFALPTSPFPRPPVGELAPQSQRDCPARSLPGSLGGDGSAGVGSKSLHRKREVGSTNSYAEPNRVRLPFTPLSAGFREEFGCRQPATNYLKQVSLGSMTPDDLEKAPRRAQTGFLNPRGIPFPIRGPENAPQSLSDASAALLSEQPDP